MTRQSLSPRSSTNAGIQRLYNELSPNENFGVFFYLTDQISSVMPTSNTIGRTVYGRHKGAPSYLPYTYNVT